MIERENEQEIEDVVPAPTISSHPHYNYQYMVMFEYRTGYPGIFEQLRPQEAISQEQSPVEAPSLRTLNPFHQFPGEYDPEREAQRNRLEELNSQSSREASEFWATMALLTR